MQQRLNVGVVGCGRFAQNFVPLFKEHPYVDNVYVCDAIPERAEEYAKEFGVQAMDSFEQMLESDKINCIANFTQRYMHGEIIIRALKAGKHVYTAVPLAITFEEIKQIEEIVRKTRLTFSMGDTAYYRAPTVFCRQKFLAGEFGDFVYGEAQYNHDMRNMLAPFQHSGGDDWKKFAGIPPMFYPTHSTAMILACMPGVYATHVSAQGFEAKLRTDIYGKGDTNFYGNPFSNTAMLLKLSNGGIARISENREIGWRSPETYISKFCGNEGCYEFAVANHFFAHWDPERPDYIKMENVTRPLTPAAIYDRLQEDYDAAIQEIADGAGFELTSPAQPMSRLPKEYEGLKNGHNGTHKFMIDDFCKAAYTGKLSPTNIWVAARYNIPGLFAHESALRGGELIELPDLGEPPADWEVLESDR